MSVKTTKNTDGTIQPTFKIILKSLCLCFSSDFFNIKLFTDCFITVTCYIKNPFAVWLHWRILLWNTPMSFRNVALHPTLHQPFSIAVFFCCSFLFMGLNICSFLETRQFQTVGSLFRLLYGGVLFTAKGSHVDLLL